MTPYLFPFFTAGSDSERLFTPVFGRCAPVYRRCVRFVLRLRLRLCLCLCLCLCLICCCAAAAVAAVAAAAAASVSVRVCVCVSVSVSVFVSVSVSHLVSSHLNSAHVISSHFISSRPIPSHPIPSNPIPFHPIPSHLLSSHLISSPLLSLLLVLQPSQPSRHITADSRAVGAATVERFGQCVWRILPCIYIHIVYSFAWVLSWLFVSSYLILFYSPLVL